MFEGFNESARQVLFFAVSEACEFGSFSIEPEHMLLGLLHADERLTSRFLRSPLSVESIREQIKEHTTLRKRTTVDLPFSDECKRIIASTAEEAERLGDKQIGTGHLLLGIMREENCFAAHLLRERGVQLDAIRKELANLQVEKKAEANLVLEGLRYESREAGEPE
jgi:ATP-dependent Clp protease ATP-binding subunit ClpC